MFSQKPVASLSAHLWTLHRITGAQVTGLDHCGSLSPMWESYFIQGTENIDLPKQLWCQQVQDFGAKPETILHNFLLHINWVL